MKNLKSQIQNLKFSKRPWHEPLPPQFLETPQAGLPPAVAMARRSPL